MHGTTTIIPPKPHARPLPIITLMIDDLAGTANLITVHPERFTLSRKEIALGLRELIMGWIEDHADA
jgi:hypothetical protein